VNPGDLVTVHLSSPREKFWGVLLSLTAAGATVRGLLLQSYDDWVRQAARSEPPTLGPVTAYFPAHRLDRIEVDETSGAVEGLGDRFARLTGRDARTALGAGPPESERPS